MIPLCCARYQTEQAAFGSMHSKLRADIKAEVSKIGDTTIPLTIN